VALLPVLPWEPLLLPAGLDGSSTSLAAGGPWTLLLCSCAWQVVGLSHAAKRTSMI
jgi:hypothetical protein